MKVRHKVGYKLNMCWFWVCLSFENLNFTPLDEEQTSHW